MPPPEYCGPPGARFKHNNIVDPVVPVPAADAPRSADALPRPASKQPPRRRHLPIRHLPTAASRHLPPRYSPFPDGAWRRVDSYTLVGSTICDSCTTAPTPAQQMGAAPAPDLDPDDFAASIPSGWVHDSVASTARTNLTIGLSLVLAGFIVITIVRCHFWPPPARAAAWARVRGRAAAAGAGA
ncbi:hypothetical protein B0H15DRAFT_658698 [Mycena belliarum]|uniref:Uncharacterized protein n=1 Tax=Mycena belliarum TaxID=1033014 RepID=A0AAD6TUA2_9AGAR|nr:hypothetical protein B0H15DRAFT_658698 [Mycena belliae]